MYNDDELIDEAIALASSWQNYANRLHLEFDKEFYSIMNSIQKYPQDKIFLIELLEIIFVTKNNKRLAHLIDYLLEKYGTAEFFTRTQKAMVFLFKHSTKNIPDISIPFFQDYIKHETKKLLVYENQLDEFLEKKDYQEVKTTVSLLNGLTINELEAQRAVENYIRELGNPYVKAVSLKLSSIDAMLDLTDFDNSVERVVHKLAMIFRQAQKYQHNGMNKLVMLEMEESTIQPFVIECFKQVLQKPEFQEFKAGITLQAYLKESEDILADLLTWTKVRREMGAEKIVIRLVKGENLKKEHSIANLKPLALATLQEKVHTDAQFKKMACQLLSKKSEELCSVNIASHNVFDLAYIYCFAKKEEQLERLNFEMFDGINESLKIAIQEQTKEVIAYSSVLLKDDFSNGIPFLVKRVDDVTSSCSFLSHAYRLKVDSKEWKRHKEVFLNSLEQFNDESFKNEEFLNEYQPITDFRKAKSRTWLKESFAKYNTTSQPQLKLDLDLIESFPSNEDTIIDVQQKIDWLVKLKTNILQRSKGFVFTLKKDVVTNDKEVCLSIDFIDLYINVLKEYDKTYEFKRTLSKTYRIIVDESFAFNDIMGLVVSLLLFDQKVVLEGNRHIALLLKGLQSLFDESLLKNEKLHCITDYTQTQTIDACTVQKNKMVKKVFYISDISNKELALRTIFSSSLLHCLEYWGSVVLLLQEDVYKDDAFLQRLNNSKNIKDRHIIYNNKQIETHSVKDVYEAVSFINGSQHFMSASIESLDEEEVAYFSKECLSSHLYVNKTIECESKYTLFDQKNYIDFYLPKQSFECRHFFTYFIELHDKSKQVSKKVNIDLKSPFLKSLKQHNIALEHLPKLDNIAQNYEKAYKEYFHLEHEFRHVEIEKSVIRYMKLNSVVLFFNELDDEFSLLCRILACKCVGVSYAVWCEKNDVLNYFCQKNESQLFKGKDKLLKSKKMLNEYSVSCDRVVSQYIDTPFPTPYQTLFIKPLSDDGFIELRNYFKEQRYYSVSHKYGIKIENKKGNHC